MTSVGSGALALPKRIVTNTMLEAEQPEWRMARIVQRTGVESRHIAGPEETALSLGTEASLALMRNDGVQPHEVDALVFCTQTPDYPLPPNSTLLHDRLGLRVDAPVVDITHACSGFLYGVAVAGGLLAMAGGRRALLVNGDTYSRLISPADRSTRTVFGDGAAATWVLADSPAGSLEIIDSEFGTIGAEAERFVVRGGAAVGGDLPKTIEMDGVGMLQFVLDVVPTTSQVILERNGLGVHDIDLWFFHQASTLALDGVRDALELDDARVVRDMLDTGNLVSASIPACLLRARERGSLQSGMTVMLCGFGVGLSWAAMLARAT